MVQADLPGLDPPSSLPDKRNDRRTFRRTFPPYFPTHGCPQPVGTDQQGPDHVPVLWPHSTFPVNHISRTPSQAGAKIIMWAAQDDREEVDIGQLTMVSYTDSLPSRPRPPPPLASTAQRRRMSSISYPDLSDAKVVEKPTSPRTISRSKTLPRHIQGPFPMPNQLDTLPVDSAKLPKMRRWILGLVLVDFDLELGPVIHGVYPPLWLSPPESENIAFSAFPDSLQFDQGSQVHSFRIRDVDSSQEPQSRSNDQRPVSEDGFIYGYSYFTQRRDASSKRGYQQRSIVILTHHQYPALFSRLAILLGEEYQTHDVPTLEVAFHNIVNWSDPTPGTTVELGFLGSVMHVELPHTINQQQLMETVSFDEKFDPSMHILASSPPFSPPPLLLFEACLSNLWSIWECVVLCEPILVFGPSPAMTSSAIWWFRDLLRPIPLASDVRPYFTIHDKDHSVLVNKLPPKSGLLIGVTNPIFEKSCTHWPHVLSLGRRVHNVRKNVASMAIAGPMPGWKTKTHKRFISKDRSLLKDLEEALQGSERMKMDASLNLRRHFCSRTAALLVPLNRYITTLIPSPAESTSAKLSSYQQSRLKPFSTTNFLVSLKTHGSPLPFRSTSKRNEFYERWLKTPAFGLWLGHQEEIVQRVLRESAERMLDTPSSG